MEGRMEGWEEVAEFYFILLFFTPIFHFTLFYLGPRLCSVVAGMRLSSSLCEWCNLINAQLLSACSDTMHWHRC